MLTDGEPTKILALALFEACTARLLIELFELIPESMLN